LLALAPRGSNGSPIATRTRTASWSAEKGIVTLRNPKDQPQTFGLDVGAALEWPQSEWRAFFETSVPWKGAAQQGETRLQVGRAHPVKLDAFEVLTLELTPLPLF